jgi:hypothetical protein
VQGHFDGRLGIATPHPAAKQARRDHPRVIEHQHITRTQVIGHVGNDVVNQFRLATPGRTISCRALSRGLTGRSATSSGGNSKSNRSTFIAAL